MGLDQYAYVTARAGDRDAFYEDAEYDRDSGEFKNKQGLSKPREIAYWRKHPNLQGWMRMLWLQKLKNNECATDSDDRSFNGVELELTWADLDSLEQSIIEGILPKTSGFFFGEDSDEYYREQDLEFIRTARAELFMGLKVFYNSSW